MSSGGCSVESFIRGVDVVSAIVCIGIWVQALESLCGERKSGSGFQSPRKSKSARPNLGSYPKTNPIRKQD
jgi:hypothetical protein